jgi:methylated-DNA-protein-cysteine methyltransferase-like protein
LEKEGVEFDGNGRILMKKYLYEPGEIDFREKGS